MIPVYFSFVSVFVLLVQLLVYFVATRRLGTCRSEVSLVDDETPETIRVPTLTEAILTHISSQGGTVISAYKILTFAACFGLLGLSLSSWIREVGTDGEIIPSLEEQWPKIYGIVVAVRLHTSFTANSHLSIRDTHVS